MDLQPTDTGRRGRKTVLVGARPGRFRPARREARAVRAVGGLHTWAAARHAVAGCPGCIAGRRCGGGRWDPPHWRGTEAADAAGWDLSVALRADMRFIGSMFFALLIAQMPAVAVEPEVVERHAELSMLVTGSIEVDSAGNVRTYSLDK